LSDVELQHGVSVLKQSLKETIPESDRQIIQLQFAQLRTIELLHSIFKSSTVAEGISTLETEIKAVELLHKMLMEFTENTESFWRLINWVVVSYYWIFLGTLGQIAPTTYVPTGDFVSVDFNQPMKYSANSNIFANDTLFQSYASYLTDVLLPMLGLLIPFKLQFQSLNDTNRFAPPPTTFTRSYIYQFPGLKAGWAFSTFTVVFTFVSGAFKATLFLVELWGKREAGGTFLEDIYN
jgi:hypothetical protein